MLQRSARDPVQSEGAQNLLPGKPHSCCAVLKLYPTLCNPQDCRPPGSLVHGILQATMVKWVAIHFSRGSSQPRDQTWVLHCRQILYHLSHQAVNSNMKNTFKKLSRRSRMQNCTYCIFTTIITNVDKSEKEYSKRRISDVLVSWSHLSIFSYDSTFSRFEVC